MPSFGGMRQLSLQTRLLNFIAWIRPDPEKARDIRKQRDFMKARIRAQAEADGLIIRTMPAAGSFATGTSIRRHMLGGVEQEGQDIDCPFVIANQGKDGDPLAELLSRFERYARACYPDTLIERTNRSVRLKFESAKVHFDLVPMLAVKGSEDEQILLRASGEHRLTSIEKHVHFVRERMYRSQDLRGPVLFNEAVRLVKWWRENQLTSSTVIGEVPSFLVDLLCAKAFDEASVWAGYAETLVTWFDRIYAYAAQRRDVAFDDYDTPEPGRITAPWRVIDPANTENNAVPSSWESTQIDELRDWAARTRDNLRQAIAFELRGRDTDAMVLVSDIFGDSFRHHSEE